MNIVADPTGLAGLRGHVTGTVVEPGHPRWPVEVAGFNSAIVHRPALVVVAATVADIVAAVDYAAALGIPVAVEATGHGAHLPVDDGVLIKTHRLDGVTIDRGARTATVQAGARWRQVIDAAAPHGLAPLSGSASGVGAVGYTLGGGLPVMARTFGFAADHVRSLDVVTADGQLRTVDAHHEPDLFWGLRGGGGNLGVVAAMTIDLMSVSTVYGGGIFYAGPHISTILRAWHTWCQDLPESVTTSIAILRVPPAPELPAALRGRTVAHLRYCHVGTATDPVALLAPMRAAAPALIDGVSEIPYAAIDSVHQDPDQPLPFCHRGLLLNELTVENIDALVAAAGPDVVAPLLMCELRQLGGALRRAPAGGGAICGREATYSLVAVGLLTPETATRAPQAVDAVLAAVEPAATGRSMLNLHGIPGDELDRARGWNPSDYQRLRDLVERYDPQGLFRFGHAIGRRRA